MPITIDKQGFTISGVECDQYHDLHHKIEKMQPIDDLIAAIDKTYLKDILNLRKGYMTDDFSNTDYLSAIHVAAKHGNLNALKTLIEHGADFRTFTSEYGRSALHLAAEGNHPDIIEYLVREKKMSPDTPTHVTEKNRYFVQNDAPLITCAARGSFEAAAMLISLGCNVHYQNSRGCTAFHSVCAYGFSWNAVDAKKIVSLLLDHNIDIKAKGRRFSSDYPAEAMHYISESRIRNEVSDLIANKKEEEKKLDQSSVSSKNEAATESSLDEDACLPSIRP
jgi:ankyrin repeat protein